MQIYGIPEGKEGKSVADFAKDLLKSLLDLPPEVDLQIQWAHRALVPKLAATATARSIIVHLLQFQMKEMVLQKARQTKVVMDNKRILTMTTRLTSWKSAKHMVRSKLL